MSTPVESDDLEAVRSIAEALTPFEPAVQERILKWAREKIGLPVSDVGATAATPLAATARASVSPVAPAHQPAAPGTTKSLRQFVDEKKPSGDNQFAATVAYYYQFEAPPDQRKESINKDILRDATRLAPWRRLPYPGQTLINTCSAGYLNKAGGGAYSLSTVGENLVAMTLPGDGTTPAKPKSRKKAPAKAKKKVAKR